MLSISVPMKGVGKGEYYLRLAQEDYYFNKGEPLGQWYGKGALKLGLTGRVEPDAFRQLLAGFSPDGQMKLVQNAGDQDRQSGWDLTFSVPKSVSVLWAHAPVETQKKLESLVEKALHAALDFLQREAATTRRGKNGQFLERAEFLFATFRHSTSREMEPQLHFHTVLINTCVREDGSTGTVWSSDFFKVKKEAGAVFTKALARLLEQELHLTIEPEKAGFHVQGVPRALCEEFSTRSKQIKEYLAEHGESGAIAAKEAALATRRQKESVSSHQLFEHWRQTGERFGWNTTQVQELLRKAEAIHQQKAKHQKAKSPDRTQRSTSSNFESQAKEKGAAEKAHESNKQETSAFKSEKTENVIPLRKPGKTRKSHITEAGWKKRRAKRTKRTRRASRRERRARWVDDESSQYDSRGHREKRRHLARIEWTHIFPNAPKWNPAHQWKVPYIAMGRKPRPRWAKIHWKKTFMGIEVRLQQRRLFRNAPEWSFAKNWALPALRVGSETPTIKPKQEASYQQKQKKRLSHSH